MSRIFSETLLDKLDPVLKRTLKALLQPDEKILYCYQTQWNMIWVQVVTSQQVIVCKACMVKENIFSKIRAEMPLAKSILLEHISHIEQNQSAEYNLFVVYIYGEPEQQPLEACFKSSEDAQPFLYALDQMQNRSKSAPDPEYQTQNVTQRMRQLEQLYKEGLISEAEYTQKRTQIIQSL